jgi:hypothetical protein
MSALPPAQAGVGSAINDLDRELGGAFGVAWKMPRRNPAQPGYPAAVLAQASSR